jgi:hypothetical protein
MAPGEVGHVRQWHAQIRRLYRPALPYLRQDAEGVEVTGPWLPAVAVDPGGTTGIVSLRIPFASLRMPWDLACNDIKIISYAQYPEVHAVHAVIAELGTVFGVCPGRFPLVIESFSLRKMSRDRELLSPVRVGERIAERVSPAADGINVALVWQTPSGALGTVTDERLKRWGLYRRGQPHARDALRHAVHLLRRARADDALRKEWWSQ